MEPSYADRFVKIYDRNEMSILDSFTDFLDSVDYPLATGEEWRTDNCVLVQLPVVYQEEILREYLEDDDTEDSYFEFTRAVYYWNRVVRHSDKETEGVKMRKMRDLLETYKDAARRCFTGPGRRRQFWFVPKKTALLPLVMSVDEILGTVKRLNNCHDYVFLGLLYSGVSPPEMKKMIDRVVELNIDISDSFDIIDTAFRKYRKEGFDVNSVFGEIVNIVRSG